MNDDKFRLPEGVELVLASASPRRRMLLSEMGLSFSVCPCEVDESLPAGVTVEEAVVGLAVRKARAAGEKHPAALILASDTLVEQGGRPLGKPTDEEDAFRILSGLSGKEHRVHTGVALLYGGRLLAEKDSTRVFMRPFTAEEIWAYIATGETMDKAGAYGIQGLGGALVERIEGHFDTVVGLPTALCDELLRRMFQEDR